jgi:predicted nucleotidyltransferase
VVEKLLVKIAKALDKNRIPYMIIGGQAVLLYGVPRLTEDIDITLEIDVNGAKLLKTAIRKSDLRIPKGVDNDFIKETNVLVAVDKKSGIRIDFIFSFSVYEQEALKRAKSVNILNYKVKFPSCEDLIIHKIFAGRERDLEDARIIIEKNFNKIDKKYIRK